MAVSPMSMPATPLMEGQTCSGASQKKRSQQAKKTSAQSPLLEDSRRCRSCQQMERIASPGRRQRSGRPERRSREQGRRGPEG